MQVGVVVKGTGVRVTVAVKEGERSGVIVRVGLCTTVPLAVGVAVYDTVRVVVAVGVNVRLGAWYVLL